MILRSEKYQALQGKARWIIASVAIGLLTLAVAAGLFADGWSLRTSDPLASKELATMKADLRDRPTDEALRAKIQQLDFELRSEYFRRQERLERGGWVVLALGAAFLLTLQLAAYRRVSVVMPEAAKTADRIRAGRIAQAAVTVLGVVIVAAAGLLGWSSRNWSPPKPAVVAAPLALPPV
ncbi:MAG: hypothetical protein EHM48_03735, partial [Planctomycetaceae bacterium]